MYRLSLDSSFHGLDNGKTTPGPVFKRKQAEDWRKHWSKSSYRFSKFDLYIVFHQDQVIRRVNSLVHQLNGPSGYQLTRRPFRINWFINQLAMYVLYSPLCCSRFYYAFLHRCLVLWSHDTNLDDALKLAKSILIPIDVLNALWPCPGKPHGSWFKRIPLYRHLFFISHTAKM
jgi:hypothetical protein